MADDAVYVNVAEGVARMMNNPQFYVRMLAKFAGGPGIGPLEAAFVEGDVEKTLGEAHTLKGLAANLSLTGLFERSLELEAKAKEGELDRGLMDAVKAAFVATMEEIERVKGQHG